MKEIFQDNNFIINEPDIQDFIVEREIAEEDLDIVKQLSIFPKKIFLEYHNYFNLLKERSVSQLENDLRSQENAEKKNFLELLLKLTKKYDWSVSWNFIRVMGRRKNN